MTEFEQLPKTSNRITYELCLEETSNIVARVEKLEAELPTKIAQAVLNEIQQSLNKSRSEIMQFTNEHKEHIVKEHKNYHNSLLKAITNNTRVISESVNNNYLMLVFFGLACGIAGGLVIWGLQKLIMV